MAEELTLEYAFGQAASIHRNQLTRGPQRQDMDRARDDFFAGSMLAGDQDIRVGGSEASDGFQHRYHRRRCGNKLGTSFNAQQTVFSGQPFRSLQRAMQLDLGPQNGKQPLVLPRLLNKIARASPHGLDRQVHVAPCGHHDDRERAVDCDNIGKESQPFLPGGGVAGIVQIDQHRIVGRTRKGFARKLGGADYINLVALRLQQQFNGFQNVLLVVGSQDAGGFRCALRQPGGKPSLPGLG